MHPVIRIICYLLLTLILAQAELKTLALGAIVLLGLYLFEPLDSLQPVKNMLYRMRWLFLSILIIYFWFTPGIPLAGIHGLPSDTGMILGLERVAALALLVLAVGHLLTVLPQQQLLAAILSLAAPLRIIGVAPQRLALRLILTLRAVTEMPGSQTVSCETSRPTTVAGRAQKLVERLADRFEQTLQAASAQSDEWIEVAENAPIPVWQWLYPFGLISVFILLFGIM